jgi:molybdopterin molybdotransferase
MIPLDDAVTTVLDGCHPLPPRRLALAAAQACVLASDVSAREAVPPFANTAMDGYAVRAADVATVPVELPVVAEVAAGHAASIPLEAGHAMRIFTGAPMPEDADAVVMVERTEPVADGTRVVIHESVAPGTHVRPAGDDLRPGDKVASAGDQITPGRLGVLRSLGIDEVDAYPRPWVGVLSTGDELVGPTVDSGGRPQALQPGQIRDTNRPTLLALVAAAGFEPVDLGCVPDDVAAIRSALEEGIARCDALLSSGGVSMGDTDLVKVVLDRLAGAGSTPMRWMQVAIKPAKPLAFGVVDAGERRVPVFGLPGNPVSAMVSFELFARPGLRRLAGFPDHRLHRLPLRARAGAPIPRVPDGKTHFVRVVAQVVDGDLVVWPLAGQGSHQLSAMAQANALAVAPDGPSIEAHSAVDVLLLGEPGKG